MLYKGTANILSLSRIFAVPLFLISFFYDGDVDFINNHLFTKVIALIIVIYSSISDGLDGYYARKENNVTTVGAYLDPFADKVLNIAILLCFLSSGYVETWMVVVIYFRESAVEGLRTLAAQKGKVISARCSGKWKTGIQMGGIIIILVGFVASDIFVLWFQHKFLIHLLTVSIPYFIVLIITVVTVFSGIDYFYHFRYLLKQKN